MLNVARQPQGVGPARGGVASPDGWASTVVRPRGTENSAALQEAHVSSLRQRRLRVVWSLAWHRWLVSGWLAGEPGRGQSWRRSPFWASGYAAAPLLPLPLPLPARSCAVCLCALLQAWQVLLCCRLLYVRTSNVGVLVNAALHTQLRRSVILLETIRAGITIGL